MRRSPRLLRLLSAASLLIAMSVVLPATAAPQGCGEQRGPWTVVDVPAGPTGQSPHLLAVVPSTPRVYVADAQTVWRSDDAGCSWTAVLRLPTPATTAFASVVSLAVPSSPEATDRVHVLVADGPGEQVPFRFGADRLVLLSSQDAGGSWRSSETPLPATTGRAGGATA
jgi:hypothetical protein